MTSELKQKYQAEFLDALSTLAFSWNKLKEKNLPQLEQKNLEEFEAWEALTARFARTTDIFLSKYLRFLVLELDPGFRGEMRDLIDKGEKANIVSDADKWMAVRELRNMISHEYTREDIIKTLKEVLSFVPFVLSELEKFKK